MPLKIDVYKRQEFIIDQGYYNNQYRVPSKEFKDFQAFQRREVAKLAKEMVDITHELGCEAMMFLGDHWIGTEPFMDEFKTCLLYTSQCFFQADCDPAKKVCYHARPPA